MSDNYNVVEMHGCIVCARVFNVLAVYTPEGELVGCTVTSPGGHCLPDEPQPLVACDTHTPEQIKAAHHRWLSRESMDSDNDDE